MFTSETDYIFYTPSVTDKLKLSSQISIALKKFCSDHVTEGMLSSNFKSFLTEDNAYQYMGKFKGTPAYWKTFLFEVSAMVQLLGLPTFFMTLSCVDLIWDELISIIAF